MVYNSLDKNHDGQIDVNELCSSMILFYNPSSYKLDADCWSRISRVNWAPVSNVLTYLQSLNIQPSATHALIKILNIENNPNLTFAQYLRARNEPIRSEIDKILFKVPLSRSPSPSPTPAHDRNQVEVAQTYMKQSSPQISHRQLVKLSPRHLQHSLSPSNNTNRVQNIYFNGSPPQKIVISNQSPVKPY